MTNRELYDAVQKHGGIRPAGRALGMPESTIRVRLRDYDPGLPEQAFELTQEELSPTHIDDRGVPTTDRWGNGHSGTRRYLLTSAQNNVRVHEGFLANLLALARDVDAELMVSCVLYDKTGYRGLVRKGETTTKTHRIWWDERIKPFMVNERVRLHKRLAFCGELDVLASARRPLSGLDAYCGRSSVIVPHNKFEFRCVESRPHHLPKEMYTCGSVTHPRFVMRKTGQVAAFHHVVGALLVEVTEAGYWHVHHLNAEEDGSFYWLNSRYRDGKQDDQKYPIEALILGDAHREHANEESDKLTIDHADSVVNTLKPRNVCLHDLVSFDVRSHHTLRDPLAKYQQDMKDLRIGQLLCKAGNFLVRLHAALRPLPHSSTIHVIPSNHDEMLIRWIKETDWRDDPKNAKFYLRAALHMLDRCDQGRRSDCGLLEWGIKSIPSKSLERAFGRNEIQFLEIDESLELAGVECGMHGHVGPSGAFGTPRNFARLGFKTFTGHTHTPSIVDGCYTVGMMGEREHGYNRGPSKWMQCHGIVYPNGKRAFVFLKNGRWRA
jgi:hypothetical protein